MTDTSEKYFDMIPLYMDGLLSSDEKNEFELQLKNDPALKAEVEEFRMLQESYDGLEDDLPEPSDDVFARIMDKIEEAPVTQKEKTQTFSFFEFLNSVSDYVRPAFTAPKLAWSVAAVQMAVLVILVFSFPDNTKFETLSDPGSKPDTGIHLNVVFEETAMEKEIRVLLSSIDAEFASGPGTGGMYVISLGENAQKEKAVEVLKQSGLVKFVNDSY